MELPLISIIIPTYNSGEYIKKALESVVDQTYKNREILIIDGKSKDNTLQIVEMFADPLIQVISEKDNGIYDAINKGIKRAKGKWIYILGSDDFLASGSVLESISHHLDEELVDLVYGNVVTGEVEYAGEFTNSLLLSQNICQQAIFYKRSLFSELGYFNEKYSLYADYVFNILAFSKDSIRRKFVKLTIAHYSRDGASSQRVDLQLCLDYFEVMRPLITSKEQQKIVFDRWPYAGIDLFRNGHKWAGVKVILKSSLETKSFAPLILFAKSLVS